MKTELPPDIEQAKAQCVANDALRAQLPHLHDALGQEAYRAQAIEACIAEVQQNLEALQCFTPISLVKSLVGTKQRSIGNAQAEQAELQSELSQSNSVIADLQQQIEEIEAKLIEQEQAEETYRRLIQEREAAVLADQSDGCDALRAVIDRQAQIAEQQRLIERVIESCTATIGRLNSMSGALHRTRSKSVSRRNFGSILNVANRQIAQGSVGRAAKGFERLVSDFERLDLNGESRLNEQLLQSGAEVAAMAATIGQSNAHWITEDRSFAHRYLDCVQQLTGLLKDKSKDMAHEAERLERQRQELVSP